MLNDHRSVTQAQHSFPLRSLNAVTFLYHSFFCEGSLHLVNKLNRHKHRTSFSAEDLISDKYVKPPSFIESQNNYRVPERPVFGTSCLVQSRPHNQVTFLLKLNIKIRYHIHLHFTSNFCDIRNQNFKNISQFSKAPANPSPLIKLTRLLI